MCSTSNAKISAATAPYKRIRLGIDRRKIFLVAGQEIRLDCATKRASIYAGSTLIRAVTDAIAFEDVNTPTNGGSRLSEDAMRMLPGANLIWTDNASPVTW